MYKQGEVILAPVPFTDLSASKKRPVLVVQIITTMLKIQI